jgi:polar amino acid transport system substrate-binding protein
MRMPSANHRIFSRYGCIPALALACLAAFPPELAAAPQNLDPPAFWDAKRRPDKPDLRSVRQIRFLTEDDYPPFDFTGTSGQLEGFNVDIARAVCAELGTTCTIQSRRWDTIVAALEAGQGDAIVASLVATPEARARLLFTDPYFRSPARFVAPAASPIGDPTPQALSGKRVAVAASTAHEAFLKAFFPSAIPVSRPSEAAARETLQHQEADILFGDGVSLAFWLNGTSSQSCCRFVGGPYLESRFFGEGIGMALRPTDQVLKKAIDFALFRLWERGIYGDITRRWFPIGPFSERN